MMEKVGIIAQNNGDDRMNREIDTSEFQRKLNQALPKTAKRITKMVVHYNDGSTIILEGGKVGRTGDWE